MGVHLRDLSEFRSLTRRVFRELHTLDHGCDHILVFPGDRSGQRTGRILFVYFLYPDDGSPPDLRMEVLTGDQGQNPRRDRAVDVMLRDSAFRVLLLYRMDL